MSTFTHNSAYFYWVKKSLVYLWPLMSWFCLALVPPHLSHSEVVNTSICGNQDGWEVKGQIRSGATDWLQAGMQMLTSKANLHTPISGARRDYWVSWLWRAPTQQSIALWKRDFRGLVSLWLVKARSKGVKISESQIMPCNWVHFILEPLLWCLCLVS